MRTLGLWDVHQRLELTHTVTDGLVIVFPFGLLEDVFEEEELEPVQE